MRQARDLLSGAPGRGGCGVAAALLAAAAVWVHVAAAAAPAAATAASFATSSHAQRSTCTPREGGVVDGADGLDGRLLLQGVMHSTQIRSLEEDSSGLIHSRLVPSHGLLAAPGEELQPVDPAEELRRGAGDLRAFVSSVVVSNVMVLSTVAVFCALRFRFPWVYYHRSLLGKAPSARPALLFGWLQVSLDVTTEQVLEASGLDGVLMIEYTKLCMRIIATIGLPMAFILCPLHALYGGRTGYGVLSRIDITAVAPGSWLYYIHALLVWLVLFVTQHLVSESSRTALELRRNWLERMPRPQATTLLLRCIPDEECSDHKLQKHFDQIFGRSVVESTYVLRNLPPSLTDSIERMESDLDLLKRAEGLWARKGNDPQSRPKHLVDQNEVDSIDFYSQQLEKSRSAVSAARRELALLTGPTASPSLPLYLSSGFVTFQNRRDLETAVHLKPLPDNIGGTVRYLPAPEPSDVNYEALQAGPASWRGALTGYACILFCYFKFFPIFTFVAWLASANTLRNALPGFNTVVTAYPLVWHLWVGVVTPFILSLLPTLVPTIIAMASRRCFSPPSETECQHYVLKWHFCFLVTYVLLVFSVGSSIVDTYVFLMKNPGRIFSILATTLPRASRFYLSYMEMQVGVLSGELLRLVVLAKFMWYCRNYTEQYAHELAEPEDPDYHGRGARHARLSLVFVMTLVLCSVCPLICLFAFIFFALSRVIYGYLLVFTETKKPDSGGVFFRTQLRHIRVGMMLYIMLMVGIIFQNMGLRSYAGWITLLSFVYLAKMSIDDASGPSWNLTIEELSRADLRDNEGPLKGSYTQPQVQDVDAAEAVPLAAEGEQGPASDEPEHEPQDTSTAG